MLLTSMCTLFSYRRFVTLSLLSLYSLSIMRPLRSTLFPYTTLFRSIVRVIVFISFLVVFSIVYLTTTKDIQNRTQNILTQQINYLDNNYKVSMNRFEIISDSLYNTVINEPRTLELLYKAKHFKDESKRAVIREILYKKLKRHFQGLKKLIVVIILFSFKENKKFLRVSKPRKLMYNL